MPLSLAASTGRSKVTGLSGSLVHLNLDIFYWKRGIKNQNHCQNYNVRKLWLYSDRFVGVWGLMITENTLTTKWSLFCSHHFNAWRDWMLFFITAIFCSFSCLCHLLTPPPFLPFTCFSKVSLKTLVVLYVSLELVPVRFYLYLCTCVCLWRCNDGSSVLYSSWLEITSCLVHQ